MAPASSSRWPCMLSLPISACKFSLAMRAHNALVVAQGRVACASSPAIRRALPHWNPEGAASSSRDRRGRCPPPSPRRKRPGPAGRAQRGVNGRRVQPPARVEALSSRIGIGHDANPLSRFGGWRYEFGRLAKESGALTLAKPPYSRFISQASHQSAPSNVPPLRSRAMSLPRGSRLREADDERLRGKVGQRPT